ncbi:sensor histidine kinase [Subdoligranulum variabile]|uniref:histidine kinase n=1 Tax=Subdoligranulum variabile DSM 15176 TaxID=411471 RepID=D1PPP5_9FIRM|nr:ATP-binding protein [Subdoligranulum variabile]EFB75241.1 ATPase/histidine kinase/DNA gyrase B/HSP90 domain protein [Subdoligranulum variabile DSM 15176]UWP69158.1 ATP-binding protein [Subdoligranulum variabile]
MPLIVAAALLAVSVAFSILKRQRGYFLLAGLSASLFVYLLFTLIYIAKKGGIGEQMSFVLFVTAGFRRTLQFLQLTLPQLGYGMAIGRYLFPWLFLLTALDQSATVRTRSLRRFLLPTAVLPVLSLILYHPAIFLAIASDGSRQRIAVTFSLVWVFAYLVLGCAILLHGLRSTRIRYIRNLELIVRTLLISIAVLFAAYAPQDPAQVYLFYRETYMTSLGLWYLNPYLSPAMYLVILFINTGSLLLSIFSMMTVAKMEWSETQDDIRLERRYDIARTGGGVFMHGIKNQLLANRVLCRRLNEALEAEAPDLEQVRLCARQLADNTDGMLSHVQELYKSLKSNSLSMRLCSLDEIIDGAVKSLCKKYPAAAVEAAPPCGLSVLADPAHLQSALTNLLINGWESTVAAGRSDPLHLSVQEKNTFLVICVQDQGTGISKYDLKKIFEPFYSSKNSNSNWGMGLYYVRTIVKRHMGTLKVESCYGKGSSFYILLPKLLPEHTSRKGDVKS